MTAGGTASHGCIRVVIAEDQAMVLGALAALLEMEGDIKVIAQVAQRARGVRRGELE